VSNEIILAICVTAFVLNVLIMSHNVRKGNVAYACLSFVGAACAVLGVINTIKEVF
jgi:hypothetical protein